MTISIDSGDSLFSGNAGSEVVSGAVEEGSMIVELELLLDVGRGVLLELEVELEVALELVVEDVLVLALSVSVGGAGGTYVRSTLLSAPPSIAKYTAAPLTEMESIMVSGTFPVTFTGHS